VLTELTGVNVAPDPIDFYVAEEIDQLRQEKRSLDEKAKVINRSEQKLACFFCTALLSTAYPSKVTLPPHLR
jgi:hypothetical protein